ncbi:4-hydroxy-tetrahydrodipicolinate synthase [Pigmentiphaga humi]|uniref:4-hydroxy-tetrahydrodipicolinate synthase n=1 Tax=Pigmentiphaga humi TaxID=2478468 RepID=A0A3P4B0J9_9BURK|nr:dihydrodipicolinate synthase family protein [Pigmentiphaga humi]VCU69572.1 4-hydroxy-tetrahydrodipicolinate synthase [Pigmentiphaga humi]
MDRLAFKRYITTVLPMHRDGEIDEHAWRQLLRYFLKDRRMAKHGGLCINPEAGEIFYLSREERRRVLEIAMEEIDGKVPVACGVFGLTTKETVESAQDAKALGAQVLFVFPPQGAIDVGTAWNPTEYPEVWTDMLNAIARATDLPMIAHPTASGSPPLYGQGIPLNAALRFCRDVPSLVGWKMLYPYPGYRTVAHALRQLDRPVAVLSALGNYFHEYRAMGISDGTMSGYWNYALEPMLDHMEAWDEGNAEKAAKIWNGSLLQLQEAVSDRSRLHIRYKVATWLRGLIPTPYMRAPLPVPRQQEIDMLHAALQASGLSVIDKSETQLGLR